MTWLGALLSESSIYGYETWSIGVCREPVADLIQGARAEAPDGLEPLDRFRVAYAEGVVGVVNGVPVAPWNLEAHRCAWVQVSGGTELSLGPKLRR